MTIHAACAPLALTRFEKRRHQRNAISLKGKLFIPQRNCEEECTVVDLSTDGAGVKCIVAPAVGTRVVLYVECFGRFDGVVVRRDRTRVGVEFHSGKMKRERTRQQLADFIAHGMRPRVAARSAVRSREAPPVKQFIAPDGTKVDCAVIDISLGGAALRTASRPAIGSLLAFGEAAGRVVRHTEEGIAVEFIGRRAAEQSAEAVSSEIGGA